MTIDWRALNTPDRARGFLGARLARGRVTPVLGAGVSMDAGLPSWKELLEGAALVAGFTELETKDLLESGYYDAGEAVRGRLGDSEKLNAVVRACLYRSVTYKVSTLRTLTLVALGSWLRRDLSGPRTVVSLNFDDLLEWYCGAMGIEARGSGVPTSPVGSGVTVLHPHGFLPQCVPGEEGRVVFSRSIAEAHLGGGGREWITSLERVMTQTISVFYGMSMESARDWTVSPLLRTVSETTSSGFVGFWLFGSSISGADVSSLKGLGVMPLQFASHEETAEFILSVARAAYLRG